MKKFGLTLKIAFTLIMARTFGRYIHSGWNGEFEYAKYEWRGHEWCVPLTAIKLEPQERPDGQKV
jgi:hypothetical protein